jgi:hypothetical protein
MASPCVVVGVDRRAHNPLHVFDRDGPTQRSLLSRLLNNNVRAAQADEDTYMVGLTESVMSSLA